MPIDWAKLFEESYAEAGAIGAEVERFIRSITLPLTAAEIAQINASQHNPFPPTDPLYQAYSRFDPVDWRLPRRTLPASYLSFLKWSNGGSFRNGERWFDSFFPTTEVRDYLLAYRVPQYIPDALPFAFDGGGHFYLFDMRKEALNGEFPIVYCGAGNLGWDESLFVAPDFVSACKGTTNPGAN